MWYSILSQTKVVSVGEMLFWGACRKLCSTFPQICHYLWHFYQRSRNTFLLTSFHVLSWSWCRSLCSPAWVLPIILQIQLHGAARNWKADGARLHSGTSPSVDFVVEIEGPDQSICWGEQRLLISFQAVSARKAQGCLVSTSDLMKHLGSSTFLQIQSTLEIFRNALESLKCTF